MRSIEDLVVPLVDATLAGNLVWEDGGLTFWTTLSPYVVHVWSGTNEGDGSAFVSVALYDQSERMLDQLSADEYQPNYDVLHNLFRLARRSANNIEEVVGDVMSRLQKLATSKN
jgi:hypothetical protein